MALGPSITQTAGRGALPSAQFDPRSASAADMGGQVGAAVADLGQGVAGLGQRLEELQAAKDADHKRVQDFTRETNFVQFATNEATRLAEASRGIEGSGVDFQKEFVLTHAASAQEWLNANGITDERDIAEWTPRLERLRSGFSTEALGTEFKARDNFYTEQTNAALETFATGINRNPNDFESHRQSGLDLINATGLPQAVKDAMSTDWRQTSAYAYGQGLGQRSGNALLEALGGKVTTETSAGGTDVGLAFDVLLVAEGGLDAQGRPRTSSAGAHGVAQVMEGTGPEAARLAGVEWNRDRWLNDTEYNRQLGRAYFAEQVRTFGGDIRKGWAAYNAGPRWVSAAVERAAAATPGTEQADWFWQLSNDGRTAANRRQTREYVEKNDALYAQRGGAAGGSTTTTTSIDPGGGVTDTHLADLTYDQRMSLMGMAERGIQAEQQQAAQAARTAQARQINQLELDILDGNAGPERIRIAREQGVLTDATDVTRLTNLYDAQQEKNADINAFSMAWADPNFAWNPYDTDQRKAVDAAFAANGGDLTTLGAIVSRTGIVPPSAATALRGALLSNDPQRVDQAASTASNILARSPNAFTAIDGGKEIEQAAISRDFFINTLGLSQQEAAARLASENDPVRAGQLRPDEQRRTAFTTQLRTALNPQAIANALPGSNPRIVAPQQGLALAQDYLEIAADNFRQYGDPARARDAAQREINRLYGVTSNGTFMKYPPEKIYPPAADGSHNYIYAQAAARVNANAIGVDSVRPQDVVLLPSATTAEAWRQGQPAPYSLAYVHEVDGQRIYDVLPGSYRFNPPPRPAGRTDAQAAADVRRARETAQFRQNAIGAMVP